MAFKPNDCQQLSFDDSFIALTEREKKALEKSWAKIFADEIFPAIDEERFSVLYSDKASRSNTAVNVIIGALIIKELFDYSDDEIVENLMLDLHLQYALHTTSFVEQPVSDKTLSRFRKRCYDYETLHGVDLYHDCVKDLSGKIAKIMKLNGRIRRMDSLMIESNIRFLSRMELIYTCISKLVVYLTKKQPDIIPEQLKHYADPNDYNRIFYHQRNDDMGAIIQTLLTDSGCLLHLCGTDFEDVTEYQLFTRCLSDQTVVENEKRRMRTKEDGTMNSSALQNPSDPDATYRNKAGKQYRGYSANIEETVGKNGSVVTDYQYDKNTHTDSQFLQGSLSAMEKSEEEIILVTDGGYDGQDNKRYCRGRRRISCDWCQNRKADRISQTLFEEFAVKKSQTVIEELNEEQPFIVSWSHYLQLMRIENVDERKFYEIESAKSGWGIRTLQRQYNSSLYERLALSRDKDEVMRLAKEGNVITKPEDIVKQPTVLEFLGLDEKAKYVESDLETAIINKLQKFLRIQQLEFCYVRKRMMPL